MFDYGLFTRKTDSGITILILYVDNMIIIEDDSASISDFKQALAISKWKIWVVWITSWVLKSFLTLLAASFLRQRMHLIFSLEIIDCKTASTPLETNLRLIPLDGTPLSDPTCTGSQ